MAEIAYNNPGTQGTGRGGALLAQYLMELSDRENKISLAGKAAHYLRQSLGTTPEQRQAVSGIDDDHWNNMGSADKASWAQGYQDRQSMSRLQALTQQSQGEAQYLQDRGADYRAQADQRNRDNAADQSFAQRFLAATSPALLPGGPGDAGSPLATRLLGTAAPQLPNPSQQDILRLMLQSGVRPELAFGRAGALGPKPAEFFKSTDQPQPLPGLPGLFRVPTGPNSSEIRDANGGKVLPTTDETRKVIGYSIATGNGTARFMPVKNNGQVTDVDRFKAAAAMHAGRVKAASGAMQLASPTDPDYKTKLGAYNQALRDQEDFLNGKTPATGGAVPDVGEVRGGFKFLGGDPADQGNWAPAAGEAPGGE